MSPLVDLQVIVQSTTLANMPRGPSHSCLCPRCNGTTVSLRTLQRHAACVWPTSIPIPSFSAWSQCLAGTTTTQSPSSSDSDVDDVGHSSGSPQHNIGHSRPSKRFRSSTVRPSPPYSIPHSTCTVSPPPVYVLYLCTRIIHTSFTFPVVCLSEPEQIQLQDDPNDANLSNHHERSPTPFHDNFDPLQPDNTNGSMSDSDPGYLSEHEQQDAAFQAEWDACTMAFQALNRLGSDLDTPLETGSDEELGDTSTNLSRIENIKFTQEFIEAISTATFKNGCLDDDLIHHLHNPCNELTSISDPDICLSLDLFLAVTNASEEPYHACRKAILRHYPDSGVLSYYAVKQLVAETTGVVAVYDDIVKTRSVRGP